MIVGLTHCFECWLVVATFLVVAGDTFATAPFNALVLVGLLLVAHVLARTVTATATVLAADVGDRAGASPPPSRGSGLALERFLDPTCAPEPEVVAAFIAAWTGSAFAVLDWRAEWTDFPWLSLYFGAVTVAVVHLVRRAWLWRSRRGGRGGAVPGSRVPPPSKTV